MSRLRALLHVADASKCNTQQPAMLHVASASATRNATAQQATMLHVASAMECNTQQGAEDRKARALAFLEAHPNVKRACFANVKADPENIVLTVAIREPWGAVEVLVQRERFDALALMELAGRYPATALQVPEH